MDALVARFRGLVKGVISGFDRIVFKGRILPLMCEEKVARERQRLNGTRQGLIGVWSCQESCYSYKAQFSKGSKRPRLRRHPTRCNHLYFYFDHADFGSMNIRLQT